MWNALVLTSSQLALAAFCLSVGYRFPRWRTAPLLIAAAALALTGVYLAGILDYAAAKRLSALLCIAALASLAWMLAAALRQMLRADHEFVSSLERANSYLERLIAPVTGISPSAFSGADRATHLPAREARTMAQPDGIDFARLTSLQHDRQRQNSDLVFLVAGCVAMPILLLLLAAA